MKSILKRSFARSKAVLLKSLFIMVIFCISNCSDDDEKGDTVMPIIQFVSPVQGENLVFGWGGGWPDTQVLNLEVLISDNVSVAGFQLEVTDDEGNIVEVYFSELDIAKYTFKGTFVPQNSGNYHFQGRAEDSNGNSALSEVITVRYR